VHAVVGRLIDIAHPKQFRVAQEIKSIQRHPADGEVGIPGTAGPVPTATSAGSSGEPDGGLTITNPPKNRNARAGVAASDRFEANRSLF
jgi:hypothetical protein